ncbi:MAG: ATP-binding protein, partial [Gammaproteobacteria bacterium]|nr:ATP-binding protein [Gammaproteobacteria bacterium]
MTHGKTRETLAGFLYEAELSHLVGREKELRNFLDDLDQSNQDLHIYNLYGPAGIGKSVLLNSYQKLANDRQITFIR